MTDRDALLAAITANPDDDTPRLVYADWLDENGEGEFAAFIRAELIPGGPASPTRRAKTKSQPWSPVASLDLPFPATTRRGFVAEIECGITEYLEAADRLGPLAPSLAVKLIDTKADRTRYVEETDRDVWAGVRKLMGRLAACRWVRTWHTLDLERHCFCDEGLEEFTSSVFLGGLRSLNASRNELGDNVCIVACENLSGLTWLNLSDNNSANGRPGDLGFESIVRSHHLAALRHLDFGLNRVSDAGVSLLATSPHMPRLRTLDLSNNLLSDGAVRVLSESSGLSELNDLRLAGHDGAWRPAITADGAGVLTSSRLMDQLTALDLHSCPLGDAGVWNLTRSPRCAALRRLNVASTDMTTAGVRELARSPYLQNLTELDIYGPTLDAETAALLASPGVFPHMARLSVSITSKASEAAAVRAPPRARFGTKLKVNVRPPLA